MADGRLSPGVTITNTNTALSDKPAFWDRTFACFLLVFFLSYIATGVFPPILPQVMADLRLSFADTGLLGTAFGLCRFIADIPTGLLVERLGAALILHSAMGLLIAGTLLSAMASSFWGMCLARASLGLGSGMIMVFGVLYLMQQSAVENRTRRANLYEMSVIAGQAVSAEAGGLIASRWGWRWSFILGLFVLAIAWVIVTWGVLPHVRSVLATRSTAPASRPARRTVTYSILAVFVLIFAQAYAWGGGINILLPLYGGDKLLMSPEGIGRVMAIAFWVEVCLLFPVGWAADVWGKAVVILPGMIVILAGIVLAPFTTSTWGYGVAFVLLVSGMSVWMAAPGLLAELSPGGFRGRSAGFYRLVTDFAFILSPAIAGWAIDRYGFTVGAATVAAVVGIAIVFALRLLPIGRSERLRGA